jgi:hypothetical protein
LRQLCHPTPPGHQVVGALVPPGGTQDLQLAQLPPLIVSTRPRFFPEFEESLRQGDIADADERSQNEGHTRANEAEVEHAPSHRIAPGGEPFERGGRGSRGHTQCRVEVDARRHSIRQGKDPLANDPAELERPHSKVKPPVKSADEAGRARNSDPSGAALALLRVASPRGTPVPYAR